MREEGGINSLTKEVEFQELEIQLAEKHIKEMKASIEDDIAQSSFAEINNDNPELTLEYRKTRGAKTITVTNNSETNLFIQGIELSLFPLGESMAYAFARKGSLFWLLTFSFCLGFCGSVTR